MLDLIDLISLGAVVVLSLIYVRGCDCLKGAR